MHMADALISPAVGGAMWAASAGVLAYSSKKLREDIDEARVPLMGVLGAFVFAAQMINFTIPATGSSGHLGGGMLLAVLLRPHAAFLTIASVLTVQALFFADGGLLALGCNIFNLGFFPCFIAYPLVYRTVAGESPTKGRIFFGATLSAVVGLQLGALGVVLETFFSGIAELPFSTFLMLMQPIHLAIGVVEGLVTAMVVIFVLKARPEMIGSPNPDKAAGGVPLRHVMAGLLVVSLLTGGGLSWFASARPDGLEWAMFHTAGKEEIDSPDSGIHSALSSLQERSAILPGYGFQKGENEAVEAEGGEWPAMESGTTMSGLVGGAITLVLAGLIGLLLKRRHRML